MKTRTYYGEYSLKYWINMMLNKGVELPGYQRYFVWDKNQVKSLVSSLEEKQFVPPVTIGRFHQNDSFNNYVLDGQQRLTSLLLAYLNYYPKRGSYQVQDLNPIESFANENDDLDIDSTEESEILRNNILEWRYDQLINQSNTKEQIISTISSNDYEPLGLELADDFFETTYLGFSYILPISNSNGDGESNRDEVNNFVENQQRFYASVFRNINIQGRNLKDRESRAALYFLKSGLENFLDPQQFRQITINRSKIDFVRYLSFLAQYKQNYRPAGVAAGYAKKLENYYEEFIYSLIGNRVENDAKFYQFSEEFLNSEYDEKLNEIVSYIEILNTGQYSTIIDADIDLFGLIYYTIFEEKTMDSDRIDDIRTRLRDLKNEVKDNQRHTKTPGALKWIQDRIEKSIELYGGYFN